MGNIDKRLPENLQDDFKQVLSESPDVESIKGVNPDSEDEIVR